MKLRIVYGGAYGLFGFVLAALLSLGILAIVTGIFWIFLFGDNSWPGWANLLLKIIYNSSFGIIFVGSIILGIRKAKKLESEPDQVKEFAKAIRLFLWSMGTILIFNTALMILSVTDSNRKGVEKEQKQQIKQLLKYHQEIHHIDIIQKDQGIEISVHIPGPVEGEFLLNVAVIANGYVESKLMDMHDTVSLKLSKQSYHFYVPFAKISGIYKDKLLEYIPFFEKEFQIDEFIDIEATLQIKSHNRFSQKLIDSVELPVSKRMETTRFNISCLNDQCSIIQGERPAEVDAVEGPQGGLAADLGKE